MNKETNTGDGILKIKDDFLSASHKLSYILNNIDVLSKDHSTLHNVIDEINHLHRKYINAKMEYTEKYYNQDTQSYDGVELMSRLLNDELNQIK